MIGRGCGAHWRVAVTVAGLLPLLVACGQPAASARDTSPGSDASATPTVDQTPASSMPLPSGTPAPSPPSTPSGTLAYVETVGTTSVIHVAAADGSSDVVIAEGGTPAWSPDGDRIAYACPSAEALAAGRVADLCVMNADGSDPRLLVRGDALSPRWSPDGARLLFNASPIDLGFSRMTDADGTNVVDVGPGAATWSPDGAWIALVDGSSGIPMLTVVRADGSESHEFGSGWNAEWSPDSTRIATTWVEGSASEIRAVDLRDGTVETLLTVGGGAGPLAWIAPGTIAYVRADSAATPMDPGETTGVWVADTATGEVRQLTAGTWVVGDLVPSPDGAWLAFEVADGDAFDIALVSLDGELARLTTSGAARLPDWRPANPDE